jgi:hypothetical protein
LARHLWRRDFGQSLAVRLNGPASTAADTPLMTLVASLPTEAARTALARRWEKTWTEDFGAESSLPVSGATSDPGLLVVLKQLPREAPSAKAPTKPGRDVDSTTAKARSKPGQPEMASAQRAANEQLAKHATLVASENFIRLLDQRLLKAAQFQSSAGLAMTAVVVKPVSSIDEFDSLLNSTNRAKSTQTPTQSPRGDSLPPELGLAIQPGARVQEAYRLNWPDDFRDQLPADATGALAICFQRIECVGEANSVAAFYQRQLNQSSLRTIESGRWVDSLTKPDIGRVRSVDVMITRLDTGPQADHAAAQRCTIDLLVVEVPDPREPTSK